MKLIIITKSSECLSARRHYQSLLRIIISLRFLAFFLFALTITTILFCLESVKKEKQNKMTNKNNWQNIQSCTRTERDGKSDLRETGSIGLIYELLHETMWLIVIEMHLLLISFFLAQEIEDINANIFI